MTVVIFKLDAYTRLITLLDGTQIPLDAVSRVESPFLEHLEVEGIVCKQIIKENGYSVSARI